MRQIGVLDVHLRRSSSSAERMEFTGRISESNVEIVDKREDAGKRATVGQRDRNLYRLSGCGCRSTAARSGAGHEKTGLQVLGVVFRRDMGEVAGYGVTLRAPARAVEISFSGLGIAGDDVQSLICTAVTDSRGLHMKPGHDIGNLRVAYRGERRHTLFRDTRTHQRPNQIPFFVVQHNLRTNQVGPGRASSGRCPVTEST